MYVEDFIENFPIEFVESVEKNYENQKARIIFTSKINEKYGGHIFHVIMILDANLRISGLGFMGMDLRPLHEWITNYNVFEGQPCNYSIMMDGFPQHLSAISVE